MKLQVKSALIMVVMLCILLSFIILYVSTILVSDYTSLEETYIRQDVSQAASQFQEEAESLSTIVADWGPWDDTYRFVTGEKPDYVKTNLVPTTYQNLLVNFILITDTRGAVLYSGAYDLQNRTMVPVPPSLLTALFPTSPLLNHSGRQTGVSGILLLPEEPAVVSSWPVVYSDFTGTPVGSVIMGRFLNDEKITLISQSAHQNITIQRIDQVPFGAVETYSLTGGPDDRIGITVLGHDRVLGYTVLPDIENTPALLLSVEGARSIYQQGLATTREFVIIILLAGICFGVLFIGLHNREVLARLGSLSRQVQSMGEAPGEVHQVDLEGDDEIADLAVTINSLLAVLDENTQNLHASEVRFRELADLLPQIIFEMDRSGRLLYVNRFGLEIFGLFVDELSEGRYATEFLIPSEHGRMKENLDKIAKGERSKGELFTLITKKGKYIRAIIHTAPIVRQGTVSGFRGSILDITDRIRLEENLAENKAYLQTLFESSKIGFLIIDADSHRVLDANPAALQLLKAQKEDIVGNPCQTYLPNATGTIWQNAKAGPDILNTEDTLISCDHQSVPIIKYAVPVTLHQKPCVLLTFVDNTERRQMENEIRNSRERLENILKASPVVVFETDPDGYMLFATSHWEVLTGYPFERMKGRHWTEALSPDDRGPLGRTIREQSRTLGVTGSEGRIIRADGRTVWIYGQSVTVYNPDKTIRGHVGTITDITGRKLAEEALAENEQKYRALTENTPDILISADLDGTITYVSPQVNQYGFLPEELTGRQVFDIIYPEDRQRIFTHFQEEIETTARFTATFRILDKWGNINWFEERSFLQLDPFGKPLSIIGILRDVTENQRARDAIELANKKLNLMNNITRHDILNTITGLLGCVDMARASVSDDARDQLLVEAKNLVRLIEWQINFTKQYQEIGVHLPHWQNLEAVIAQVVHQFDTSGLAFTLSLDSCEVYADPMMEKVFYNLVDNSVRYGKTASRFVFSTKILDHTLELTCKDNGTGIPAGEKEHIFERGIGQNTGMGLFLSREILGITGISIHETGVPGEGAIFVLVFPAGTYRFITHENG